MLVGVVVGMVWGRARLPALASLRAQFAVACNADAPVDDFGLVDLEVWVTRFQARPSTNRAIDVFGPATGAADHMVVVVTHPWIEAHRRTRRLDATHELVLAQNPQGVVDRLPRDGADFGSHRFGDFVGGAVRMLHDGVQHTNALRSDMEAYLAKAMGMGLLHSTLD
jgi:hypothetical protein